MNHSELVQAKTQNKPVLTPIGTGLVNGIGGKFTFIYFQDSSDNVAGRLIEFSNDQIEPSEYCPNCRIQVEFETKMSITGLNNHCVNCGDFTR